MNDLKGMKSNGNYECAEDAQISENRTAVKPILPSNIGSNTQPRFEEHRQSDAGVISNISTLPGQAVIAKVGAAFLYRSSGFLTYFDIR